LTFIIFQILVIVVAFIGGYLVRGWQSGSVQPDFKFPVLAEAYQLLQANALSPLPADKKLEYGMIRGMLQVYNEPFTVFVEPPQHELQTQQLQGKFGGIGVRLERDDRNNVYLYPLPDSPALKAGVKEGDRLFKIGPLSMTQKTTNDELQAAIRGPIGQKVEITIGHKPDYNPVVLTVDRQEMALPSIAWNIAPTEPGIGVIHVHIIAGTTPDEVTKAINDLKAQGAKKFIIDIRNNGGGLVDAVVDFARLFLKSGVIIGEQYRGQPEKIFQADQPGPFSDLPMVILMNNGTASAAEIFAGALQGQKRAPLIGSHSYGKDTIQLVFSLSDGSSLHVTSAHWWIPGLGGQSITGKGLQPDILLPDNAGDNQFMQAAMNYLK
jgi:carboxyl-terminal processing protease